MKITNISERQEQLLFHLLVGGRVKSARANQVGHLISQYARQIDFFLDGIGKENNRFFIYLFFFVDYNFDGLPLGCLFRLLSAFNIN